MAATCSADGSIRIYRICGTDWKELIKMNVHKGPVMDFAWGRINPKTMSQQLISGGQDGDVVVSEILLEESTNNSSVLYRSHLPAAVLCVATCEQMVTDLPIDYLFAVGSIDGSIALFHQAEDAPLTDFRFQAHDGGCTSISFHPHGYRLVSGGKDGLIKTWTTVPPFVDMWIQPEETLKGHFDTITSLSFMPTLGLPNVNVFASASADKKVIIWSSDVSCGQFSTVAAREDDASAQMIAYKFKELNQFLEVPHEVVWNSSGLVLAVCCGIKQISFWSFLDDRWIEIDQGENNFNMNAMDSFDITQPSVDNSPQSNRYTKSNNNNEDFFLSLLEP
eukprot:TRINITY_DN2678_c0_g1_i1.p1 TRINITY_DN2678_c0_g1~~TRINITY_DN2678_c0_g1_i1.p1  ORF type:complete len:367 (+),score=92.27 TRINITY_DN2678_c0_g1_i1:98-1102(+)